MPPARIDEIELRVVRLPFRAPVRTSYGVESEKVAVLAIVRGGGVEGYGEGSMEVAPTYSEETIGGALHLQRSLLIPDLLDQPFDEPSTLLDRWSRWRGNPMAKATLETAAWDWHARRLRVPLQTLLGATRRAIAVGASLGIAPLEDTLAAVDRHVAEGYQRIKVKIEPGWDLEPLTAVRARHPDIELSADGNGAYRLPADLPALRALDPLKLAYIEQPLHWDDLVEHAALASAIETPICLDESLRSPERVAEALAIGACSVVNVKVGRVGGLEAVRRIHHLCAERDVPMWCGGMYDTGVGRAHNIHLASMPGFRLPGDIASASRTFARDIVVPPLEAKGGSMRVPSGPGIGVELDRAFLDSVTESVERFVPTRGR
jgi:O-succinylbenzoate synthase